MNIKPITFSTPMVQAILAGNKTQTRRVIKPQPSENDKTSSISFEVYVPDRNEAITVRPKYRPGDVLCVKETWAFNTGYDDEYGEGEYVYRADNGEEAPNGKWRPSIHMPRAAARIFLKVTDIQVERLQNISGKDAIAEGFMDDMCDHYFHKDNNCTACSSGDCIQYDAHLKFKDTWDNLNAKRGSPWNSNPWVWKIAFERVLL